MPAVSNVDPSLPNVDGKLFDLPTGTRFVGAGTSAHAPRFLMLPGHTWHPG
jgi:arsenic resistance protein ArsH